MAETRRNEQQDPSGDPQGATPAHGAHADAHAGPAGNRPATGARAASAPPDSGWQAGAGATDFLGLEPELRTGGAEGGPAGGPTESWLFDIEQAESGATTTAVATAAQADADGEYGAESEYAGEEGTEDSELEAVTAVAEDFTDEPEAVSPAPARRGARRVLVSLAVLAALGTGGWYAWQRFGPRLAPHTNTEVATATPRPKPAKPAPAEPAPAPASGPATAVRPEPSPPTAVEPTAGPGELAAGDPPTAVVPADVQPATQEPDVAPPPETAVAVVPDPTPAQVTSTPTDDASPLTRSANLPAKDPELPEGNPGPGGGRHATARDWAGMWLEPTIPTDAIRGPTRLRTLNVGLVRAELLNGEFVEGRLHAVGESRIWLDVKLGRMSFDASDVRDLVQVVGAQGQPLPLGSQSLAGLARVEVLLPGGSLTGRVLGREGDRVTFLTEEGMRLRVEALDVRPAPTGRSRLVGPAAARKP